jgi:hypothetical protein
MAAAPAPAVELLNTTLDLFGNWTDTIETISTPAQPGGCTAEAACLERPASNAEPGPVTSGLSLVRRDSPSPRQTLRGHIAGVEAIADAIEQLDAEDLDDELRDQLSASLIEALAGTRAKVDATARTLAMFEHLAGAARAEKERLAAREAYYDRQIERLQGYVLATMEASDLPRLDGDASTLKRRANPPSAIPDASIAGPLPAELMRPPKPAPWAPDKDAIKRAIGAGREVPGWSTARSYKLVRS